MQTSTISSPTLVLASGSRFRSATLSQIGLTHVTCSPGVDETPRPDEAPETLALRLSRAKALAGAAQHPQAIVIGSDQTGECEGRLLSKPGTARANVSLLEQCSGATATFYSGLAVYNPARASIITLVVRTYLTFRQLNQVEIAAYVAADQAFDCAGGFKIEGRGITLFERVASDDPSALVGLPVIALTRILRSLSPQLAN